MRLATARPSRSTRTRRCRRSFAGRSAARSSNKIPWPDLKLPAKLHTRDRVLTNDELKEVWTAAEQLGNFGVIVKLLILTGQRRGEIANLHQATIIG